MMSRAVEKNLAENNENITEYRLVRVSGAWTRQTRDREHRGGRVSDAKILESVTEYGVTWTVVSPIVFTYNIVECEKLLDVGNDTLLFGHVTNGEELQSLKSNPKQLKRFIVIDETVNDLYGAQVAAYFKTRNVVHKILPLTPQRRTRAWSLWPESWRKYTSSAFAGARSLSLPLVEGFV